MLLLLLMLLPLLLVSAARACTNVNLTKIFVSSAGDLHPFQNIVPTTGGALKTQTCESVNEAFDGDKATKWLQRDFGNGTWLTFRLPSSPCVTKYELTSANDAEGRDPQSWIFSGSPDGQEWTVLDHPTDVVFSKRRETLAFPVKFSRTFNWYRFEFLTVRDPVAGGDMVQLADFALYTGACGACVQQQPSVVFALKPVVRRLHSESAGAVGLHGGLWLVAC